MRFVIKQTYEKEDIKILTKAILSRKRPTLPTKASQKVTSFFALVWAILLLIIGTVALLRLFITPGWAEESYSRALWCSILALFLGIMLLLSQKGRQIVTFVTLNAMWYGIKKNKASMEMEYQFDEDCFTEYTTGNKYCFEYADVQAIAEGQKHYLLFADAKTAHILRKDSFLEGDPVVFGSWLSAKLGKEIKEIH